MPVKVLGDMTVIAAVPLLGDAATYIEAAVGATLPSLTTQADVMANFDASVSLPAVAAQALLDAWANVVASPPGASISADISADMALQIKPLELAAEFAAGLSMLDPGVRVSIFSGSNVDWPSQSQQVLPEGIPNDQVFGVCLFVNSGLRPNTVKELKTVFGIA